MTSIGIVIAITVVTIDAVDESGAVSYHRHHDNRSLKFIHSTCTCRYDMCTVLYSTVHSVGAVHSVRNTIHSYMSIISIKSTNDIFIFE